jgi:hypothetical protein
MLRRVLIDNEAWFITAGIFGMSIKVYDKERGLTRTATRYERLYLLEVLECMKDSGIRIGPESPEVEAIFQDFAEAIFLRGRPTWEVVFLARPPKDWADSVLPIDEGHQRKEVLRFDEPRTRASAALCLPILTHSR